MSNENNMMRSTIRPLTLRAGCLLLLQILSALGADSWNAYHEQPCCGPANHHRVRHHRDHVWEFSCESKFYHTLYMDTEGDRLYVGAMDRIFMLNLSDISQTHCERDSLLLEPSDVSWCMLKGKSEYECRNHIRVIQPLGDGHRLYICGTNAHEPKDWVIYMNLTHLPRHEYVPGVGSGIAKCPYDPADNSTAVWVTAGNPGALPALYAGTNAEFTQADPVIFRSDLYDFRTGVKLYPFKRTLKYDSKWLDKTDFVGSFDAGLYVLMFLRETAVEYMNCGKAVYSRVARVCKQDKGGIHILAQNWATFLKARLNCSLPGEFPFYFDEIQSVYQMPDDQSLFYATFTTGASDGMVGSAICVFSLDGITDAFNGKFKEQASSGAAWLPVLRHRVPEPRPGSCVNDTATLPDSVLSFIRSHPLMDEAVRHQFDKPIFYKRDVIFTHLAVDRLFINMLGADKYYTVYYVGTISGEVYKIVHWVSDYKSSESRLADIWPGSPGEPIRALRLSRKHAALYVATDIRVRQLPLVACTRRYDSCLRCVLDPYCGWDKDTNQCKPYKPGLLQDATNSTSGICENHVTKKKLVVTFGQSLHLGSYENMPEVFKSQVVTWYHHSKHKGRYKMNFGKPDKIIQTIQHGIVLLSITDEDSGRYECYFGPTLVASYHIEVDMHRCLHPNKTDDFKKIYSDWCHEFEKYKTAMTIWQKKQMFCGKKNDDISQDNENNMRNEISTLVR